MILKQIMALWERAESRQWRVGGIFIKKHVLWLRKPPESLVFMPFERSISNSFSHVNPRLREVE
jgi:hypothetical protein